MNRDPMTAGGTQDAGAQNPQSEGNSENNLGTDASNSVGQSEMMAGLDNASTEPMNTGSDSLAGDNAGQVISYDNFTESDSNDMGSEAFSKTTVSDAVTPNADTAMDATGSNLAADVADPNLATGAPYPTETFNSVEDNAGMNNVDSAMNPTPENLAQTPDATVASAEMIASGPEGAMVETATEEAVAPAENPQPSPAVLSALESMGASTDTPATKSVVEPVSNPSQISTAKVPKPNRKGLVVGLIILAVLMLIAGGLAIWFFVFYNNPTKVAFDALGNLVSAENVNTIGSVRIVPPAGVDDSSPLKNIMVNFDSTGALPGAANATLSFDLEFDEKTEGDKEAASAIELYGLEEGHFEIKLGTVQMTDGVIYLRVAGIMASLEEIGVKEGSPIYESMQEYISLIDLVDDEWWQISVPDIIDSIEPEEQLSEFYKDYYNCALDLVKEDKSAELKQLWSAHPFAELEPISRKEFGQTASGGWNGYYDLKFNTTELASFVNGMVDTTAARNFYACSNAAAQKAGITDDAEISAEDIDEADASDFSALDSNNVITRLEISRFGHQLKGLTVNSASTTDTQISTSLMFTYQPSTIVAPDNYRPISELIDEVTAIYNTGANSSIIAPTVCADGTTVMDPSDCDVSMTIDDDQDDSVVCEDGTSASKLSDCPEWNDDDDWDDDWDEM